MSTRREVILSWLCEKRQTWRLCYLLGEAGSGKTWLAQQLQKDKHRRVITLSLVVSWQGKAAWIVTDDNAAEQGCRDSAWTRDEMAGQLLHALHRTDSRCPLIIIENAPLVIRFWFIPSIAFAGICRICALSPPGFVTRALPLFF